MSAAWSECLGQSAGGSMLGSKARLQLLGCGCVFLAAQQLLRGAKGPVDGKDTFCVQRNGSANALQPGIQHCTVHITCDYAARRAEIE